MDETRDRAPVSLSRIGVALAVAALLSVTGIGLLQDRLLYFPDAASVEATVAASGVEGAQAWPDRAAFRGVLAEPPGRAAGTAVVFHGNAGHAGHRGEYAARLRALGWRVVLAEYPGYGARPGTPGEATLVADAQQTVARVRAQFGGPLVVIGESLGAAVAAGAAGSPGGGIDGLVLITPWDTLTAVAAHHYRWLPVGLLLADRYDSVAALRGFSGPTAVVVATADDIVPARFGRALHDGLAGRKRLVVIEDAGHNDWPDRVDDAWWRALWRDFGGS